MIELKRLSQPELVELTNQVLIKNEYLESCLKDKQSGLDKLANEKKKLLELIDRVENLVMILDNEVDNKSGNPKTKFCKSSIEEDEPYKYIYNRTEGSIRLL